MGPIFPVMEEQLTRVKMQPWHSTLKETKPKTITHLIDSYCIYGTQNTIVFLFLMKNTVLAIPTGIPKVIPEYLSYINFSPIRIVGTGEIYGFFGGVKQLPSKLWSSFGIHMVGFQKKGVQLTID